MANPGPGRDRSAPPPSWLARPRAALVTYGCFLACTQLLWLTYAPVTAQVDTAFGVSEGAVGDLAVLVPMAFVVLGVPSGRWLDRRFDATLMIGIGLTVVGAVVRALDPQSFGAALAGQSLIAVAQPLVVNAMTKLPAEALPPRESSRAIAALCAAQFVGMVLAIGMGEPLYRAGGLYLLVWIHAVVSVVVGVAVLVTLWLRPTQSPVAASARSESVLRTRVLWLLGGSAFVGFGLFNTMLTWLDAILTDLGRPGTAGWSGAIMLVAGIVGAAVLPNLAARSDRRRDALLVIGGIGVLVPFGTAHVHGAFVETSLLAALGFAALAGLPIILDISELAVGVANAATATGFIMLLGNLGGTVYVLGVQLLLGDVRTALMVLSVLALPAGLFAYGMPRRIGSLQPLTEVDDRTVSDAVGATPPRSVAVDG
jgi:predicted MFS family arabinose efflux permease